MSILFVGNGLTTSRDLPGVVEALIADAGMSVEVRAVAFQNFGLQDHWEEGTAVEVLGQGGWNFVVMQQGPSVADGGSSLLEFAKEFAAVIKSAGSVPALLMVWPDATRPEDWEGVYQSYRSAAVQAGAIFLPAGLAWRLSCDSRPRLEVYDADGVRPNRLGTYIAALVVAEGLTEQSAIGMTGMIRTSAGDAFDVPEGWLPSIQTAAHEALSAGQQDSGKQGTSCAPT